MENTSTTPAWTIASEIERTYKSRVKASERPAMKDSKDTYEILLKVWGEGKIELQEEFKVLFLNSIVIYQLVRLEKLML